MRIVHITDSYLPSLGGIELHVRDRVERQRAAGDDAFVLTAAPMRNTRAGQTPDPLWVHRVRHDRSPSVIEMQTALSTKLRDLRPDVVHVHFSVVSPFALMGARAATAASLPTVVTVHSMWSGYGPLIGIADALWGMRKLPVIWSAVSLAAADCVQKALGGVPVAVLPNAVDVEQWRPTPEVGEHLPLIVAVNRLTRVKRAMPLLRMLAEVHERAPHARSVVVGEGPQLGAARRFVAARGLQDAIALPGRMGRDEIRPLLDHASVFVAPAARESFGIAALEARAMGVPVVGSSRGGVSEFIIDGVDGFLAADDAAMVNRMVALVTDRELGARMRAHNRAVAPRHDWALTSDLASSLYGQAIALGAVRHSRLKMWRRLPRGASA